MRILIVNDPKQSLDVLRELRSSGFETKCEPLEAAALRALRERRYDLLLIDLEWCARLAKLLLEEHRQEGSSNSVIALTSRASSLDNRASVTRNVDALLNKPISVFDIVSNVKVFSRVKDSRFSLQHGNLLIDWDRRSVHVGNTHTTLTPRELSLLIAFVSEPSRVFSRAELMAGLSTGDSKFSANALDVLLHRLREKVGKDRILNVWGRGFRLAGVDKTHELQQLG